MLKLDLILQILDYIDYCLKKIMKKFVGPRAKTCSYLIGSGEDNKARVTKLCVIKRNLNLKIIKTV